MKEVTIQDAIEMEEFMRCDGKHKAITEILECESCKKILFDLKVGDVVEVIDKESPLLGERGRVTELYSDGEWLQVHFSGFKSGVKGNVSFFINDIKKINVS